MKQLRKIAALSLMLVLCVLLTGCHGSQHASAFTLPAEFDTDRHYEVSFWAKNDTNKTQVAIYEKAIADFEALYPNIKVNIRLYTDYGRIYNDVITNIATGTTPNVCVTYPDHIATYLTGSNVMAPLDELFTHPYYGLGGGRLHTGWRAIVQKKKGYAVYFYKSSGAMAKNTKIKHLKIPKNGRLGRAYYLGIKRLDKTGWSLKSAFWWSVRMRYQGRWYRAKDSETYAIKGFTKGYGNCYCMAATFYVMAKLLGYDVHQVEGRVDLPHSWTVIKQDGKEWVYDPNFTNETGRNGWKIYYGKKGTWRYNHYHKMN